jgi:hypothetical protein
VAERARVEDAIPPLVKRFAYAQQVPLDGHFASMDRLHQLDLDTWVERRSGVHCVAFATDQHAVVEFAGNRIEEARALEPALRFVAQADRFAVRDLPDCLSDEDKCALVGRLAAQGLLTLTKAVPDLAPEEATHAGFTRWSRR